MSEILFSRPRSLRDVPFHYCPGCHHGIIHRLVAEAIDELDAGKKAVGVAPVGCSVMAYNYFNLDMTEAAHGRAPAVATGIKRVIADGLVFTYQGDGDLAAIGTAEIVHAAVRAEKITAIFVNNAIYGMTGGQMAPTTLTGQITTTSPFGRTEEQFGMPLKVAEMLATIDGAVYVARVAVNNIANMRIAKNAIKRAFKMQLDGRGFSIVEVLSTCPTNWGLKPLEAARWLEDKLTTAFPLGILKDKEEKL